MVLNTAEKFLILIQNPKKSRFIVSEQEKKVGVTGAVLLDLANDKKIEIENGKLAVISIETSLSHTHKVVLEIINGSSKKRKIKTWISKLSRKTKKYHKNLLEGLETKGIIRLYHKQFIGIKYYRTQLINNTEREQIISEIREIIFHDKKSDISNSQILGLIQACKMHKIICWDRKELKICKKKLKEILKSDSISQGVDRVIREMQAAVFGVITASIAGATAWRS